MEHDISAEWDLLRWPFHRKDQQELKDLYSVNRSEPALDQVDLHCSGFEWIDLHDTDDSMAGLLRRARTAVMPVEFPRQVHSLQITLPPPALLVVRKQIEDQGNRIASPFAPSER